MCVSAVTSLLLNAGSWGIQAVFMTLIHKKTDNCGETDFKLATIIHYHLIYRYKTMTDAFSPFFKSFNPVSKAAGGTHAPHMRALTSCDDEGRSVWVTAFPLPRTPAAAIKQDMGLTVSVSFFVDLKINSSSLRGDTARRPLRRRWRQR